VGGEKIREGEKKKNPIEGGGKGTFFLKKDKRESLRTPLSLGGEKGGSLTWGQRGERDRGARSRTR